MRLNRLAEVIDEERRGRGDAGKAERIRAAKAGQCAGPDELRPLKQLANERRECNVVRAEQEAEQDEPRRG